MNFLIDHREDSRNDLRAQQLKKICESYIEKYPKKFTKDTEIIIQQNLVGDIVYGNTCIEIKSSASDLIRSFRDESMNVQIENMVTNYQNNYLIIISTNDKIRKKCKAPEFLKIKNKGNLSAMIFGALASYESRKNIHVKKYSSIEESMEDMLPILVKSNDGEKSKIQINPQRIASTKSDEILRIVTSYPNVGNDTAKKLINHFDNIQNLVNASIDELKQVRDVGKVTATKIFETNTKKMNYEIKGE